MSHVLKRWPTNRGPFRYQHTGFNELVRSSSRLFCFIRDVVLTRSTVAAVSHHKLYAMCFSMMWHWNVGLLLLINTAAENLTGAVPTCSSGWCVWTLWCMFSCSHQRGAVGDFFELFYDCITFIFNRRFSFILEFLKSPWAQKCSYSPLGM